MGVSMGVAAAFANAMKHKDRVKTAVGFMPALNLRWVDCNGRYERKFNPECWGCAMLNGAKSSAGRGWASSRFASTLCWAP